MKLILIYTVSAGVLALVTAPLTPTVGRKVKSKTKCKSKDKSGFAKIEIYRLAKVFF